MCLPAWKITASTTRSLVLDWSGGVMHTARLDETTRAAPEEAASSPKAHRRPAVSNAVPTKLSIVPPAVGPLLGYSLLVVMSGRL